MGRSGVIWRLQRGPERLEAVVNQLPNGRCELHYVRNGALQEGVELPRGHALPAIEGAVERRELLRAQGWSEYAERSEPLRRLA